MFNLSIFDCRTEGEKELYAELEKAEKEDIKDTKTKLLETVKSFSGIRTIGKKVFFDSKSGEAKVSKLIAGFENEAVRLSPSLKYKEDDPKYFPLIKEIIILDCPGTKDKKEISWHELNPSEISISNFFDIESMLSN